MGYEYKEILKLDEMLNEAGIPHTITKYLGGHLIRYFGHNPIPKNGANGFVRGVTCTVVQTDFSHGHTRDLIEFTGLMSEEEIKECGDDFMGDQTAEAVFERIKQHYFNA